MTINQRILFAIYLPLTALIQIFNALYQFDSPALYLKFFVRVIMLISFLTLVKKNREHILILLAFIFSVISDYYFVFTNTLENTISNSQLYGMLGFVVSYLFLIAAFTRNFRFGKKEFISLLPFVSIFAYVILSIRQYAEGFMFAAAILVGIILSITGMTMISTLFRGYYSKKIAWLVAISGCLEIICDVFVAFSIFHPDFNRFILWKENVIWSTYMIAWTLLLIVVADEQSYDYYKDKANCIIK